MQTGQTLKDIESIGLQFHHFVTLFSLAVLSLIPTFVGKKYEAKLDQQTQISAAN
jgi:hypothetical protein